MFIPNFKILSSIDSQFFYWTFPFLIYQNWYSSFGPFIFLYPTEQVYIISQCFTSCTTSFFIICIVSSILFLQPCTFHVPNFKVLFRSLSRLSPSDFWGLVFGILAFLIFNNEWGAGPLHQPPTWRTRWFLFKVFFLKPLVDPYQTAGQQC